MYLNNADKHLGFASAFKVYKLVTMHESNIRGQFICSEFSYLVDKTAADDVEGRFTSTVEI
jgi:hypothetical protein